MLPYFPEVFPEELLFSIVSRMWRHIGSPTSSGFVPYLFGMGERNPSFALPGRMDALASKIPAEVSLSTAELIERHTLFPYYTAFASPEQRRAAFDGMAGNDPQICGKLGVGRFLPLPTNMRFCPECVTRMKREIGQLYWRRDHQLPPVLVCADHGCSLRESGLVLGRRAQRLAVPEDFDLSRGRPLVGPTVPEQTRELLRSLAVRASRLLTDRTPTRTQGWSPQSERLARLQSKGHEFGRSRIDWLAFREAARERLGCLRPVWPDLFDEGGYCGTWLRRAMWVGRKKDPFIQMLVDTVIDGLQPQSTFPEGPWPCHNPIADHGGGLTVETARFFTRSKIRTGQFTCSCGYTYQQTICPDGSVSAPSRIAYGPTLERFVVDALGKGYTLVWIERTARVSKRFLQIYIERLGIKRR